jgi:hypothetical protein
MSLVRLPRMASISPERHHHQASLRQAELNPRKANPISNHLVLVIGCPVWMRVRDADMRRHLRYSTSFRNGYAPLPNSYSLRYHSRRYPHERRRLYRLGYLPHRHNAFLHHQYRMPSLPARGQIGHQCHQSTAYKLRIPSGMARLERLLAAFPRRTKLMVTTRRNLRILCLVVAVRSCGLNGDDCFGSLWMESSRTVDSVVGLSYVTSTYCDPSSDAVYRRPHEAVT